MPSLIPQGHFFENVDRVLSADIGFWQAMLNTVIVATVTAVSVVFFSTLAGFAFAKLRFRGRNVLLAFVIAHAWRCRPSSGVIPLFIVMAKLGWTGQLVAVIVPGMVTAFGVFWMTQYLSEALPYELIEAARVDGCSMIRAFWHVALPAARPAAADAGPVHLRGRVDQLLLAVHRAGLDATRPCRWRCSCSRRPTSRTCP